MRYVYAFAVMVLASACSCHIQTKINECERWGLDAFAYDSICYQRGNRYAIVYKEGLCALYNRKEKTFITEFLYKSMDLGQKNVTAEDGVVYDFTYTTTEGLKGGIIVKYSDNSIIDGWMTPFSLPHSSK